MKSLSTIKKDLTLTSAIVAMLILAWLIVPQEEMPLSWLISGLVLLVAGIVCLACLVRKAFKDPLRDRFLE